MTLARFYTAGFALLFSFALALKALFWRVHLHAFDNLSPLEGLYALLWGMRFDAAAAAILLLLPTLAAWLALRLRVRLRLGWLLLPALAALIGLQIADLLYFGEAGRHLNYELRDALTDAGGLWGTAVGRAPGLLALGVALIAAGGAAAWRWCGLSGDAPRRRMELTLIALLLLSALLIRGGLGDLPLAPLHVYRIGDARQAPLALNGAYSALYGAFHGERVHAVRLPELPEGRQRELLRAMYPRPTEKATTDGGAEAAAPYNVVLLFLEGWSADRLRSYGYARETTPFFDALRDRSLTTREMVAGGLRTTEGLFATLCSAQNPLGQTVAKSRLQDLPYACLPLLLRQRGWSSAFFQGTHRETTGVGAFTQRLGFAASYGKRQMPPGRYPHNSWGAYDQDLYAFALERMGAMQQPFLVGINTNTTHDIQLPPGVDAPFGMETFRDQTDSVRHFADQALREFIAAYRAAPALGPTLFVLLADHAVGAHPSALDHYRIPFLLFATPEQPRLRGELPLSASQRDVAPTVMALLGLAPPRWFSGRSLLDRSGARYADYYHQGTLGWIEDDRRIELRVADGALSLCARWARPAAAGPRRAPPTGRRNEEAGWREGACDAQSAPLGERALAFSAYNQGLLFGGRTMEFGDFAAP